ncbi:MAG: DNA primase [Akkermansia sp.]
MCYKKSSHMGSIAEESIKKVLASTDIVDLINSYIPLKKAGVSWKGVCPFHNDSHPSMTVSPVRQSFKCFACGEGGDALSFVMKFENLPFVDAIRRLADRVGIPLIEEQSSYEEDAHRKRRSGLVEIHKMAKAYFHSLLKKSPLADHARAYLNGRGFGSEMATRWQVGWAPVKSVDFIRWAQSQKIPAEMLIESGLADRSDDGSIFARFRDRLMFPICNSYGECVAFSGRILGEAKNTGKYVNSPETPLFHKSEIVFGLDRARKSIAKNGCVLVCEGQMDVIACHEAGIDFAVAPLGTAFTQEHANLLKRQTSRILLCFDGDKAGMSASDRAFRILASTGLDVYLVDLPLGEDPDSMIGRVGKDAFLDLIKKARPFFEIRLERATTQGFLGNATDSATLARDMVELLSHMKDPMARDLATTDVATRMGMGLHEMRQSVHHATKIMSRQSNSRREPTQEGNASRKEDIQSPPIEVDRSVVVLCELCLQNARAQELVLERIEDLIDPMNQVAGGFLLKRILEKMPNPDDAASIHAFLHVLPPSERQAFQQMQLNSVKLADLESNVNQACSGLSRVALEKQLDETLARLKAPQLEAQEQLILLQKSIDLRQLLCSIIPHQH